jgi:competence protein ComEC
MRRIAKVIVLILLVVSSAKAQDYMSVHVVNVGQGSAMLLEFPCGVILVDTGGESNDLFQSTDALMNYLTDFFVRRSDLRDTIDMLIISHPHIDHTRGVKEVTSSYFVKNIITNAELKKGSGIAGQQYLQRLASQSEANASKKDDINYFSTSIDKIPDGGKKVNSPFDCPVTPTIKLLWGTALTNPGWSADAFSNQNNHSVVTKIDFGQASIILTGDLEDVAIASLLARHSNKSIFDSDVYLVGHHGSKNGTTLPFLQAVTPEIAILSFGDNTRKVLWTAWAYGHPNQAIVDMLVNNVSGTRVPKNVFVGKKAKKFTKQVVSKAVYGVGWDDSFVLSADTNGKWTYGMIESASTTTLVNINTATEDELTTLPSIGPTRARAIIQYRTTHPFRSIDELDAVEGIGPATIELIRSRVKI